MKISAAVVLLLLLGSLPAQEGTKPKPPEGSKPAAPDVAKPAAPPGAKPAVPSTAFAKDQLEQIAAPIALYPDALLAQVLMASTYPLEIVEAARWLASKGKLDAKQLETALQGQTWEPAVKSLCGFPSVLKRLDENLDWTQDLGDAFLAQKNELMAAVQELRRKALEAGNLKTSKELKVTDENKIIVIESSNPEVVYVPTYYPTAVYGGWAYPTYYYPPMYAYPPAGALAFSFAVGVAWGACWGSCGWGHSDCDVDIDVNNYNKFVDRTERPEQRQQARDKAAKDKAGGSGWKHDATHRKGAAYRDSKTASQFGGTQGNKRITRDQARGYDRGNKAGPAAGGGAARPSTQPSTRPGNTGGSSANKAGTKQTGKTSGSLTGAGNAKTERAASQRGSTSRGSSGSRGASGGGGSRGGGGGRGGGGRR